ncbi:TPA: outer spore coat protein CotE [Candidatus Avacholeplasma faecigallinarum]|nr:outer spore coat protein CotE [Candidatus Avacholeplasma faecigallinarum]
MNEVREIVTKAVVAKGKKVMHISHELHTTAHPYSILGCWIINHEFEASKHDNLIDIDGSLEVNIWYSTEENTKTDVLREIITYQKNIKVKQIVNDYLKNSDDVLAKILKHPTVTNAKINNDVIYLDIEFEVLAEVIGETKMQVTVFNPIETQEEDIEDLDIEVNENFLGES